MERCNRTRELLDWAAQGSAQPVPSYLQAHAGDCECCASLLDSVTRGRELGRLLPATTMTSVRHDALKFQLMAETRRGATPPRSSRSVQLGRRLLIAAVITAGAAAAAKYATRAWMTGATSSDGGLAHALPQLGSRRLTSDVEGKMAEPLPKPKSATPAPAASSATHETSRADGDSTFRDAWALLRAKRPGEAAQRFDAMLNSSTLDTARRSDVLYWSAQSHRQAGEVSAAISRSSQLLRQYPSSNYASDAALILGEYALASDQFDRAAQYLNQAAQSERSVVRERARRAMRELVKKQPQ